MNDMFGIDQFPTGDTERLVVLSASRAHSGRGEDYETHTQGIARARSALGYTLMAFQAIMLAPFNAAF